MSNCFSDGCGQCRPVSIMGVVNVNLFQLLVWSVSICLVNGCGQC